MAERPAEEWKRKRTERSARKLLKKVLEKSWQASRKVVKKFLNF